MEAWNDGRSEMKNAKIQMTNEAQNPKTKGMMGPMAVSCFGLCNMLVCSMLGKKE